MAELRRFDDRIYNFQTLNQRDTPITMKDGELPILQNFMPIGNSLWSVPGYSAVKVTLGSSELAWTANTAVKAGDIRRSTVENGCIYKALANGTTANVQPTWPTNQDGTVVDNTVTWKCYRLDILRAYDYNYQGKIYKIFVCGGSTPNSVTLYAADMGTNNSFRLNIPGATNQTFTNPRFEQWKNTNFLLLDTVSGFFAMSLLQSPINPPICILDAGIPQYAGFTATVLQYVSGTTFAAQPATPHAWLPVGFNCSNGKYNKCYLYIDSTGTTSFTPGTEAATAAGVIMPAIDTTKCLVSILQVHPTGTGGFLGGTTALNDGTVIPNATFTDQIIISLQDSTIIGTDIAVFDARVWILVNGLTYQYSAINTFTDFTISGGGGSIVDTNPDTRVSIQKLAATAGYLYAVGDHSTHSLFGSQVFASGNVAYQLSDSVPGIGSMFPDTVRVLSGTVFMVSDYGIYTVEGQSFDPISELLDGLYPNIDLTFKPIGRFAKIFNKLVYCVLVRAINPATGVLEKLLLCTYRKRWFIVAYGLDLNFIQQSMTSTDTLLYGMYGNKVILLFDSSSTQTLARQVRTKAFDMGTSKYTKHILRVGCTLEARQGFTVPATLIMRAICDNITTECTVTMPSTIVTITNSLAQSVTITNNFAQAVTVLLQTATATGMKELDSGLGKEVIFELLDTSSSQYILSGLHYEGQIGSEY